MDDMASSQQDSLSEKSKNAYALYKNVFENWRKDKPLSDDLICQYVRAFRKGFTSEDSTVSIPCHKASSTRTMFSHLRKYLENEGRFVISEHSLKLIYSYLDIKEKKEKTNQARVYTMDQIHDLFKIEPTTLTQIRDKLIFVFGVCALLRLSELYEINVEDVTLQKDGVVVKVLRKKATADRLVQTIWISNIFYGWDVASNLKKYLDVIPTKGPLWRAVGPQQRRRLDVRRFSKKKLGETPKKMAMLLKIEPDLFRSHSLRRTGASLMAANGATGEQIKAMGNWVSSSVAHRYVFNSAVSMQKNAKAIAMPERFFPGSDKMLDKHLDFAPVDDHPVDDHPVDDPPVGDPPVGDPPVGDPPIAALASEDREFVVQPQHEKEGVLPSPPKKKIRRGTIVFTGAIHKLIVMNGSGGFGETQSESEE